MKKTLPVLLVLVLAAGCRSKLNDESVVSLTGLDPKGREIDPIGREQTIKISATATSGQFNIYFFLDKDRSEVMKEIDRGKESPKALKHQLKTASAELSAPVPANERAVVYLVSSDGKKMDVKLKITN